MNKLLHLTRVGVIAVVELNRLQCPFFVLPHHVEELGRRGEVAEREQLRQAQGQCGEWVVRPAVLVAEQPHERRARSHGDRQVAAHVGEHGGDACSGVIFQ